MTNETAPKAKRGKRKTSMSPEGLEENLKKGTTELLVLYLLREREMYINEITDLLLERSSDRLNITFPYAVVYRLLDAHYIELGEKCIAPDGRRRQFYHTTPAGEAYLEQLLVVLDRFMGGVYEILGAENLPKVKRKRKPKAAAEDEASKAD